MDGIRALEEELRTAEERAATFAAAAERARGDELTEAAARLGAAEITLRIIRGRLDQARAEERRVVDAERAESERRARALRIEELRRRHKAAAAGWQSWDRDIATLAERVPAAWKRLGALRADSDAIMLEAAELEVTLPWPAASEETAELLHRIERGGVPGMTIPPRAART